MSPVEVLVGLAGIMKVFTVDAVGHIVFWPLLLVVVGGLLFLGRQSVDALRPKAWMLPILPACWILAGLAGVYYAVSRNPTGGGHPSLETGLVFGFVGFLLLLVSITYALKDAKLFAALWAVTNLYFMVGMSTISYMAVSGIWPQPAT